MSVVIDASVALKWVLEEEGAINARALLANSRRETLLAPGIFYLECANALWVRARRSLMAPSEAQAALQKITRAPLQLFEGAGLAVSAQSIALEIGCSVYDGSYLAVALAENAVLVTADTRLVRLAEPHVQYRAHIREL